MRHWEEVFSKAKEQYSSKMAAIKTNKNLTEEGKNKALFEAEKEFVKVWLDLENEYQNELFQVEEELNKLLENPVPRPTPDPATIAAITFEGERLISVLTAAGRTGQGLFAELSRIEAGSEAQKRAFLTYFNRFIDLPEKVIQDKLQQTRATSKMNELYKAIDKSLLSPAEVKYKNEIEAAETKQREINIALSMARRMWEQTGVSLNGLPDPWKQKLA